MKAVNILKKEIKGILKKKEYLVLGIVGGNTVESIFNDLKKEDIEWERIHIFMIDERCVDIDSEDSNYKLARECFIDELIKENKISPDNLHPFLCNKNEDFGAKEYYDELKEYGGKFDIIILSAGEDGHVASLFPGKLDNKLGYISIRNAPKEPANRVSASKKLIEKSEFGLILFGRGKEEAYNKYLDDKVKIEDCPAKVINAIKKKYVITWKNM